MNEEEGEEEEERGEGASEEETGAAASTQPLLHSSGVAREFFYPGNDYWVWLKLTIREWF